MTLPWRGRSPILPAMADMISIVVNGDARIVPDHATVAALLGTLGMDSRKVAVGRNTEFVAPEAYDATPLAAGDRLDIVQRIGLV